MPPETASPNPRRRALAWLLKAAAGVGVLGWLLREVRPSRALDAIARGDSWATLVGAGLLLSAIALQAVRLRILAGGVGLSTGDSARITLASYLFNQILPGGVGGEGYRALRLSKITARWPVALGLIAIERLHGAAALLLPGAAYMAIERHRLFRLLEEAGVELDGLSAPAGAVIAAIVGSVAAIGLVVLPRLPSVRRWLGEMAAAVAAAGLLRHVGTFAASCAYHLSRISGIWIILHGMEESIAAADILFVLVVTLLVSVVPSTLGALGVKEGAIVLGLSLFGVPEGDALAVALLNRAVLLAGAAAGVAVLLAGRRGT